MAPDERALHAHLGWGRFLAGVAAGRWRLISVAWPFAIGRGVGRPPARRPGRVRDPLRAERLPTHRSDRGLWDVATNSSLPAEQRPKGERRRSSSAPMGGWAAPPPCMPPGTASPFRRIPTGPQKHPRSGVEPGPRSQLHPRPTSTRCSTPMTIWGFRGRQALLRMRRV